MCAVSFENYGDGLWFMRVKTLDSCSATTIDTGAPVLTTWVGGEATYTKNPVLPVHMEYQDALSHPWSQNRNVSGALAATVGCLTREASCTPNEYVAGCSQPNFGRLSWTPGYKTNSFDCGYDFTNYADGRVTFCAYQSDSALVDQPDNTNQYANQNSANANKSATSCGNVILDRGAPTVNAGADRTVKVGDLVTLNAQASDAISGVGQIDWTFGDNTPGATGVNATHTYTQPGTYIVKAATKDGAGNTGEDTAKITVEAIAPPPPPPPPPAAAPAPDRGGGTGGGGTTDPPPTTAVAAGRRTRPRPTAATPVAAARPTRPRPAAATPAVARRRPRPTTTTAVAARPRPSTTTAARPAPASRWSSPRRSARSSSRRAAAPPRRSTSPASRSRPRSR